MVCSLDARSRKEALNPFATMRCGLTAILMGSPCPSNGTTTRCSTVYVAGSSRVGRYSTSNPRFSGPKNVGSTQRTPPAERSGETQRIHEPAPEHSRSSTATSRDGLCGAPPSQEQCQQIRRLRSCVMPRSPLRASRVWYCISRRPSFSGSYSQQMYRTDWIRDLLGHESTTPRGSKWSQLIQPVAEGRWRLGPYSSPAKATLADACTPRSTQSSLGIPDWPYLRSRSRLPPCTMQSKDLGGSWKFRPSPR